MTSIHVTVPEQPSLKDKIAVITGASSGIGLATAKLFVSQGAKVINLDVQPPAEAEKHSDIEYKYCDQSSWQSLRESFHSIVRFDVAVANAAILERGIYFDDTFDEEGELQEPPHKVLDINLLGTMNFVKFALSGLKKQGTGGSIVMTASSSSYMAESHVPMYSAGKAAVIGILRALRPVTLEHGITINAVAPGPTRSGIIPDAMADQIRKAGIVVNEASHIAKAVLHSITATEDTNLEVYDDARLSHQPGRRWHGRCLFSLGDEWREVEEPILQVRKQWLGENMEEMMLFQQNTVKDMMAKQKEDAKKKENGEDGAAS